MNELTVALADRNFNNTAKLLIILHSLGGKATNVQVVAAGIEHGATAIKKWNVGALLASAKGRVARLPGGWQLLPNGYEYLKGQGWTGPDTSSRPPKDSPLASALPCVFIGHGHANAWRELKDFLQESLGLRVEHFNSVSVAGLSVKERLGEMLGSADFAFLVMTAEDDTPEGGKRARMNVIHEAGLFQGRLGFEKAIVLLEEGCEEFSNMTGTGQIRFPTGDITARSEAIREVLHREGILRHASRAVSVSH